MSPGRYCWNRRYCSDLHYEGVVTFWDIATFKIRPTRLAHVGVCTLAFAPDNSALASGGFDGTIYLWAFPVVTGD